MVIRGIDCCLKPMTANSGPWYPAYYGSFGRPTQAATDYWKNVFRCGQWNKGGTREGKADDWTSKEGVAVYICESCMKKAGLVW